MHLHNFQLQKFWNFHSNSFTVFVSYFFWNLEKAWTRVSNLPSFWSRNRCQQTVIAVSLETYNFQKEFERFEAIQFWNKLSHFKFDKVKLMLCSGEETQLNNFSEQNCEIIFSTFFRIISTVIRFTLDDQTMISFENEICL